MYLDALTREQCHKVREWRNKDISMYRTPHRLTQEMQDDFYNTIVCNRKSDHKYFSLINKNNKIFLGMGGLVYISLENRSAEISLVVSPAERGKGLGDKAVKAILDEAFNRLNLDNVYGECYCSNQALGFWEKMIDKYGAKTCKMPNRKFWDGKYWDSLYFNFERSK